jgi:hypothetical protein
MPVVYRYRSVLGEREAVLTGRRGCVGWERCGDQKRMGYGVDWGFCLGILRKVKSTGENGLEEEEKGIVGKLEKKKKKKKSLQVCRAGKTHPGEI